MTEQTNTTQKALRRGRKHDGLFQRNGWWWIDYYDAEGRRHRQKSAPDYDTAKKMYRERMTAIAKGEVLGVREESIRLKDFVENKYWPTIEGTLSEHERRRLRGILDREIIPQFGGSKLSKLRQEEIERWQAERRVTASPATVRKEMMWFKHLLYRAAEWKYLKETPAKNIKQIKEPPGRTRYLEPDEREALLKHARPDLRQYILAALQTGGRRSELYGLRSVDLDMRARTVSFPKTKNGDQRVIPMTDELRAMLQTLPRPLDQNARVLPDLAPDAITKAFRRLTEQLKLSNLTFHDLRHDVASTLTMAGVPQRSIMAILGHRDPRMTLRYQHLSPGHLQNAMKALDRPADQRPSEAQNGSL